MDIDHRPHRDSTDLFVCFTSRFCSFSSAKMSSKSILSPGCVDRFREPKLSSSSSLSRRLRASGSMKGGQSSPMLILSGSNKKRGYAFENPEPSSPKVTCIGQVRVKTRKQRARSDDNKQQRNQKWVHLPLTICEALRAFGAEFNCFMPCGGRSFCSSVRDSKSGKRTASSCGTVLARWLMAIEEEEEEEEEKKMEIESDEVKGEKTEVFGKVEIEKEEERVSICIPPRNALLLMRCRSDPVRISALANRFWDPQVVRNDDDEEEENSEDEDGSEEEKTGPNDEQVQAELELREEEDEVENQDNSGYADTVTEEEEEENDEASPEKSDQEQEQQQEEEELEEKEEEIMVNWSLFESFYQLETLEAANTKEDDDDDELKFQNRVFAAEEDILEYEESSSSVSSEEPSTPHQEEEESELRLEKDSRENIENQQVEENIETEERVSESQTTLTDEKTPFEEEEEEEQESKSSVLPDCLLSMLCEPKLSMEISKETWVCSRDFIRRNSNKHHQVINMINGSDETKPHQVNAVNNTTTQQQQLLPPRSSFSNHTAAKPVPSMAAVVMQKLVSAVAHEPFVLTRCKSEPLRSSTRLVPEACSWKNQNLNLNMQLHRRATLGVGAVGGVGRLLAQPKC